MRLEPIAGMRRAKGDPEAGFSEVFVVEVKKYKDVARVEKIAGRSRVKLTSEWQTRLFLATLSDL